MYCLKSTQTDQAIRYHLRTGRQSVGRIADNDIVLDNVSVSRAHAVLTVEEGRVLVRDLDSSNGTSINGEPISGKAELRVGDHVAFGTSMLVLELTPLQDGIESDRAPTTETAALALADPEAISAQDSLQWDELSEDLTAQGVLGILGSALFRAVTEASNLLVLPRPLNETFEKLLDVVEQVVSARRILLLLTDSPDAEPVVRAARPASEMTGAGAMLSRTIIETVLRERRALLLKDALNDPRFANQESIIQQNLRSALVAPLFDNRNVIGLLYADNNDPTVPCGRDQLRVFTLLANLIAVKVTNARLLEAEREMERMEQEVAAAAQVQQQLLPPELPSVEGYRVVARQLPCFEVAGDLYDVAELPDGRLIYVVGDVTGKGMGAAMLMSSAMAALRMLYDDCLDPETIAAKLHRHIYKSSDHVHFITLFVGILDPRTHRLDYVNAGHCPPLLLQSRDGVCETLELESTGLPIGLIEDAEYRAAAVDIPADSMLCVFSDGIPEAAVDEEFYGETRFVEGVMSRCGEELEVIADGALEDVETFLDGAPSDDDVTLLMLRRLGDSGVS